MRGEKGFALVLTLVITALMVAAAVELIHQVYVDTSLNRSFRDGQQASLLAESGAKGGKSLLQMLISGQTYTSLSDKWAVPFKQEDETGRIEITITEESGKINLNGLVLQNNVPDPNVMGMLQLLGTPLQIPVSVWNALADWIDTDDIPLANGAETPYYKSLNPPYVARNGKMMTVNELSLVKGFTPDMVAKLVPFVTIYPNQTGTIPGQTINVNTAPKEVLMALDSSIDSRTAERIIDERNLTPFKAPGELSRAVGSQLTSSLTSKVIVKGTVFRITSRGFVKDAARTVETVIRTDGTILSWQEY
jgi:general secretion pathway protein K